MRKRLLTLLAAVIPALGSMPAQALPERTLCVFDIVGSSGDIYNMMQDYRASAREMGVDLTLRAFTDENIAYEELTGGQCDAAAITGIRGRRLNSYTGSLDSVGAIPDYETLRTVMRVLASGNESINQHMRSGSYEVMGLAPMGAAYLFVKDQGINNVNALAGKSIAVMEYDEAQGRMAAQVGMSPVMSDITNFAGRFNNHSVDICFAPIAAYSALELYRGLTDDGGIVNYTLGQLTMQMIARHDRFPEGFGQKSREYWYNELFDRAKAVIDNAYEDVPEHRWVEIPDEDRREYDEMMREARINMRDDGIYNAEMLALLRNIRCRRDAGRAECSDDREQL